MNAKLALCIGIVIAAIALAGYDVQVRRTTKALAVAQADLVARVAAFDQSASARQHELETKQSELATLQEPRTSVADRNEGPRATPEKAKAATRGGGSNAKAPTAGDENVVRNKTSEIADNADLRAIRVRAFVGERRMMFAGLFHELGLTSAQLQRFDGIQAEYQQAMLDLAGSGAKHGVTDGRSLNSVRREITDARDAQLRELFGDSYGAWEEANRTQGARSQVGQLLQQTFQIVGPIENAQAEHLIAIVAKHEQHGSAERYDWPAIVDEASPLFAGKQREAFKTACAFWQNNDRAQALAAAKR